MSRRGGRGKGGHLRRRGRRKARAIPSVASPVSFPTVVGDNAPYNHDNGANDSHVTDHCRVRQPRQRSKLQKDQQDTGGHQGVLVKTQVSPERQFQTVGDGH